MNSEGNMLRLKMKNLIG